MKQALKDNYVILFVINTLYSGFRKLNPNPRSSLWLIEGGCRFPSVSEQQVTTD